MYKWKYISAVPLKKHVISTWSVSTSATCSLRTPKLWEELLRVSNHRRGYVKRAGESRLTGNVTIAPLILLGIRKLRSSTVAEYLQWCRFDPYRQGRVSMLLMPGVYRVFTRPFQHARREPSSPASLSDPYDDGGCIKKGVQNLVLWGGLS